MRRPPTILVQLVIIMGSDEGTVHEFTRSDIRIGRHPSCHLCLPNHMRSVSRQHAQILRDGNRFLLKDTSTNGMLVNGQSIRMPHYLNNGDVIHLTEMGPRISFVIKYLSDMESEDAADRESWTAPTRLPEKSPSRIPGIVASDPEPPAFAFPESPSSDSAGLVCEPGPEKIRAPLHIQFGPTLHSVDELPVIIGQKADCGIIISHSMAAPHHVQILFANDTYCVRDMTASALVRLNALPINHQSPLRPGDTLAFTENGPVFTFHEGGRLVEIQPPPPPPSFSSQPGERNGETASPVPANSGGFIKNVLLKKLFRTEK